MTHEEDYENSKQRIAKLSKRKQKQFHEALKVEHKRLILMDQVRAHEREFMAITKGFTRFERMHIDRHALLESLNETRETRPTT